MIKWAQLKSDSFVFKKQHFLLFLIIPFSLSFTPNLFAGDNIWQGGTGNWSTGGSWSEGSSPSADSVFIDNGDTGTNSVVTLDSVSPSISNLTVDSGDTLNITNSRTMTHTGGIITINGLIDLTATGRINVGNTTVTGEGTVNYTGTGWGFNTLSQNQTTTYDGTIGAGLTLNTTLLQNNNRHGVYKGTITLGGKHFITSAGSNTNLTMNGDVNVNGSGTIDMENLSQARVRGVLSTDRLTIGANLKVTGGGNFGTNNLKITNNGLINAGDDGGSMILDPTDAVDGFINNGTIHASNNGSFNFSTGTLDNRNGIIDIDSGSNFNIQNATIRGGTVNGTGTFNTLNQGNTATYDGSDVGGLTINPNLLTNNNRHAIYKGTITLNGIHTHTAVNSTTNITMNGDVNMNGTGTINMTNISLAHIKGSVNTDRLTIGSTFNVTGGGNLGANFLKITNNGLIHANADGVTMILDPTDATDGFINNTTIQASNNGDFNFATGTLDNRNGIIDVGANSNFNIQNATIRGGTINGTGLLNTLNQTNTATYDGTDPGGLTINPNVLTNNNRHAVYKGTITLNGTHTHTAVNGIANITMNGDVAMNGTGTINLSHATLARVKGALSTDRVTLGSNFTVTGTGLLGVNALKITNNGTIRANSGTLTIDPTDGADGFINGTTGLVEANGGAFALNAGTYTNNGIVRATGGSAINLTARGWDGTGGWEADNGTLSFGAFTYGDTNATGEIKVLNNGALNVTGSTLYGGDMTIDGGATSSFSVASSIILSGDFTTSQTVAANWGFDDDVDSTLQMNGGVGGAFVNLEIAGSDLGSTKFDPTQAFNQGVNPDPNAPGFTNNFSISDLVIGPGARVQLVDNINNATGGGLGDEALYVDTLTIKDASSRFVLNNLPLYFNNLVLEGGAVLGDALQQAGFNTQDGVHDNATDWDDSLLADSPKLRWTDITADGDTTLTQLTEASAENILADAAGITIVPTVGGEISLFDVSTTALFTGNVLVRIALTDLGTIPYSLSTSDFFGVHVTGGVATRIAGTINGGFFEFEVPSFSGVGVGVNPEPTTLLLLGSALLGLFPFKKKFFKL